jgi:alkylation response protein AidB-like acyl-CoA dehydrogenase
MDFELSEEQEAFRKVVREFAEAEIAPYAEEWDRTHHFPVEVVQAMGELGLFGLPFPVEYGGSGADFTTFCVAVEELGRVDSSMAITLSAGVGLGANPIFTFGTEEQRQRWLPPLCAGEALAAFGLTEPDAGSDAGATLTRARLDGSTGEWVLDGTKAFITNSGTPITSLITVTARTEGPTRERGISALVVPAGTPGLVVEPPYRKMGWHASDTHGLVLDGCRVPSDHLLGGRGQGLAQFLSILDGGRIAIAALAVGLAQACLDQSLAHAQSRQSFGGPIGRHQAIAFKCADMAVGLECARTLTYKAAWLEDQGRPVKQAAAMAKLYATEAAVVATREATQVFGGAGFIDESPVSRFYRDAKILEIGEGTSEVQRLVISRGLGLPVR